MANNTPINPPVKTPSHSPITADSISLDMDIADLEKYAKLIAIKQGLRAEEERAEVIAEAARARAAGVESTRMLMAQAKLNQSLCSHKKENGRTQLGGQRDHDGVVHFICQQCRMHFLGNSVPYDLRPNMEMVGGPN